MPKRYILIVSEGCGGCEEAKKLLAGNPNVSVLDVTKSLYAADVVRHNGNETGVFKVPLLVEVDSSKDQVCVIEGSKRTTCMRESELVKDGASSSNV